MRVRFLAVVALNALGGWVFGRLMGMWGTWFADKLATMWPLEPVVEMLNADLDPNQRHLRVVS